MRVRIGMTVFAFVAASLCTSIISASAAEKALLRYKWKAGEEQLCDFHFDGVVTLYNHYSWKGQHDDGWYKIKPSSYAIHKEQLLKARVLSVNKGGSATIALRVKNIVAVRDEDGVEKVEGPGDWTESLKVTVSPQGGEEIVDLPAWKEAFKKAKIPYIVQPILPYLPDKKVGKGDTWEGPGRIINVFFPVSDVSCEIAYRLERFEDVKGKRCAVIVAEQTVERELVEGEWEKKKAGKEMKVDLKDMKWSQRSECIFDIEGGRLIRERVMRMTSLSRIDSYRKGEKKWGREKDIKLTATMASELLEDGAPE